MHKATHHKKRANGHAHFHRDFAGLKKALTDAGIDVKSKAGEMLLHTYNDMQGASSDMKEQVTDYIVDRPYKSLGIALLSGVVLGFLLRK